MHSYIDVNKLYDFSEHLTFEDVSADFDRYHIHNIAAEDGSYFNYDYDEFRYYLEEALFSDYEAGRINYRAYIEDGMDARLMLELRKSALLRMSHPSLIGFYAAHSQCETVADIKELRIKWLHFLHQDYMDLDWQVYMLINWCWGVKGSDIVIDYEDCLNDGDYRRQNGPEGYRLQWLKIHLPPGLRHHIWPRF